MFVAASALTVRAQPTFLAELALKHRLPTMFGARDNVAAGGLMSYSPDHRDLTSEAGGTITVSIASHASLSPGAGSTAGCQLICLLPFEFRGS